MLPHQPRFAEQRSNPPDFNQQQQQIQQQFQSVNNDNGFSSQQQPQVYQSNINYSHPNVTKVVDPGFGNYSSPSVLPGLPNSVPQVSEFHNGGKSMANGSIPGMPPQPASSQFSAGSSPVVQNGVLTPQQQPAMVSGPSGYMNGPATTNPAPVVGRGSVGGNAGGIVQTPTGLPNQLQSFDSTHGMPGSRSSAPNQTSMPAFRAPPPTSFAPASSSGSASNGPVMPPIVPLASTSQPRLINSGGVRPMMPPAGGPSMPSSFAPPSPAVGSSSYQPTAFGAGGANAMTSTAPRFPPGLAPPMPPTASSAGMTTPAGSSRIRPQSRPAYPIYTPGMATTSNGPAAPNVPPQPQFYQSSNPPASSVAGGMGMRPSGPPNGYPHQSSAAANQMPPIPAQGIPPQMTGMNHYPPGVGVPGGPPYQQQQSGYPPAGGPNAAAMAAHQQIVNLLQDKTVITPYPMECPDIIVPPLFAYSDVNCSPDIFRSTLNAVPNTTELLKQCRLPLGLVLQPFRDLKQLSVLQASVIVRCKACRTYINPFVQFPDQRHWKCNICYRSNELPEEFHFDPVSKSYGDPQRRPEIKNATVEFIAPEEYMLRAPQPAVYLFVLDVSQAAVESGYLESWSRCLLDGWDSMPGDKRAMIGFITYDSAIHFYLFPEDQSKPPQQLIVTDLDEVFLPHHSQMLVNIEQNSEVVRRFVEDLPEQFVGNRESRSGLGAALLAAKELIAPTGGRISAFVAELPSVGPGVLLSREDPNQRASEDVQNLNPATDFYKTLALTCSGHQIAIDLFLLSSKYADLATLSGMSKYCGGCIYYYPGFHSLKNELEVVRFEKDFQRYLTRKIGFEAVLRIRCTRGLALHTFHGNAFVRSVDLLALPNINPDSAFAVQLQMEENLEGAATVSFQAALLYTSSKGERRIRVHTLCLPVGKSVFDVHASADVYAISALLARMAVDRTLGSSLSDAREALVNAVVDGAISFGKTLTATQRSGAMVLAKPLKLWPMMVLGLLKNPAFNYGTSVRLDARIAALNEFKNIPLQLAVLMINPALYWLDPSTLTGGRDARSGAEGSPAKGVQLRQVPLSAEYLDRSGVFLMDSGLHLYLYFGSAVSDQLVGDIVGVDGGFAAIDDSILELPVTSGEANKAIRSTIEGLRHRRALYAPLILIKDCSPRVPLLTQRLVIDRSESTFSYPEFLSYLQKQMGN